MRLRASLLLPLVVLLISCGGEEPEEIEGWIVIETPTSRPTYETFEEKMRVSGSRSTVIDSANWTNSTGGSGAADLTFQSNCFALFFVFAECNHEFHAWIPLAVGANVITVTGYDSEGDYGRDSITITRLACPPPPPATPLANWPLACR